MSSLLADLGLIFFAQAPAPSEAASAVEVQSVWDFVAKGGVMMIPIGLCSLIALTVVIERAVSLRRRKVIPPGFLPGMKEKLKHAQNDPAEALEYCRDDGSPIANVFAAALRRRARPIELIERHIQETGQREVLKLRRYLRVLSVIAAISPLLGLLGTIFGMITAFQTVAASADALGKTEMLAEGIYEAMITTAAGLIVAIPVLICYHWLSAKVQKLVMEIDQTTLAFIEELAGRPAAADEAALPRPAPARDRPDDAAAIDAIDGIVAAT
ncbi:MAG: MotA/TolQ/ExbB proton channel family protein [Planctomycetota bacterium]|nr:MotA/TolQ/ExbB proton channel family protein [Planctomycetota bacterium]